MSLLHTTLFLFGTAIAFSALLDFTDAKPLPRQTDSLVREKRQFDEAGFDDAEAGPDPDISDLEHGGGVHEGHGDEEAFASGGDEGGDEPEGSGESGMGGGGSGGDEGHEGHGGHGHSGEGGHGGHGSHGGGHGHEHGHGNFNKIDVRQELHGGSGTINIHNSNRK